MAAPHLSDIDACKRELRLSLRGCVGDDGALRTRLEQVLLAAPARVIAGVWPLAGEPDLRPLLASLHEAGRAIALPAVMARGAPLLFHRWRPGDLLRAGLLGTSHPDRADAVDPDLVLVPLVAFDRARRRLGRGAGFYDRTLAARPGIGAIGFAHASREVDEVPTGPHDVALDAVVTDREVIA